MSGTTPCVRARRSLNHSLTNDAPAEIGRVLSRRSCPGRSDEVSPWEVLVRMVLVVVDGDGSNMGPAKEAAGRAEFVEGVAGRPLRGLDPLAARAGDYFAAVFVVARG